MVQRLGVIGSGSWATALVKILTDNNHRVNWWVRNAKTINHIQTRKHNPQYLSSVNFDVSLLHMSDDINEVVKSSDILLLVVPSAYILDALKNLDNSILKNKKVISAIKGLVPGYDLLLNDYLAQYYSVPIENYFTLLGPCHAEEVAAEKLSYLTFSGVDTAMAAHIAAHFKTPYINTIINNDIIGVQYAAVLKNIYALGAGMAHGLEYGDNFLSVYIANSADEMAAFLQKSGVQHVVVGEHQPYSSTQQKDINYAASVYLGDLLVTCYSLHSRNRMFGNMIGKGYTVRSAQLEMNMVAEGYNASRCMHKINETVKADMPIAAAIFKILWEGMPAAEGFERIEKLLV